LSLEGLELVLEVYWPEASQVLEQEIIKQAVIIGNCVEDMKGHLPKLIRSCDLENYSMDKI
jgi:hypothetical protein